MARLAYSFVAVSDAKHRVLLADDDHAMRGMLESALLRAGFEVESASNGAELLVRLDEADRDSRPPELIVSDICMPGLTGLDVLTRVRQRFPGVPVILITAFGDALTHRRAHALGAVEVIDKPFDLGTLCRRITTLLDGSDT
jgi:two-component system nitrogen regulation response regulator GlnG